MQCYYTENKMTEKNIKLNSTDKRFLRDIKEGLEDDWGRKVTLKEARSVLGTEDFKENRRANEEAKEHFKRTGERM